MNDEDAIKLLRLLHKYVMNYKPDLPQTIPALAEDLAIPLSMDSASLDEAQGMSSEIEEAYNAEV
jgi:hypothetical protein